jgi:hypothetical protein
MSLHEDSAASGQPIRCELVPVPTGEYKRFTNKPKPGPPPLVLDVGQNGATRLTDPDTGEFVTSTWLAEVTATPARFRHGGGEAIQSYTEPVLIVDLPGAQPLIIGTAYRRVSRSGIRQIRYVWNSRMHDVKKRPDYAVTDAEWLTLAQRFGLGDRVVDNLASGEIERQDRRAKVRSYASLAFIILALAVAIIAHFAR